MEQTETKPAGWAARQKQNTLRLGFWTAAWVVTLAIAVSDLYSPGRTLG